MKLAIKILVLNFILVFPIWSQNSTQSPDSLAQKSFKELYDKFYKSKPDTLKCILYAKSYYKKALKEKDTMKIIEGIYILSDIKKDNQTFLNSCDSLIEICRKSPSKNFPFAIYLRKARFFYQRNKKSLALRELKEIVDYKLNDSLNAIRNLYMGLIRSANGQNYSALIHFKKSLHHIEKENNFDSNEEFLSIPLNLVLIYIKLKKYDSALYYNKKAIDIYKINNSEIYLGFTSYTKANILFKMKDYKNSIPNLKKAISYTLLDENYRILLLQYSMLGECYNKIELKADALKYHLKADSLHQINKYKVSYLFYTFSFLNNYYKKSNNLEKQLEYINKLLEIKEFELTEKNKIQETFTNEFDIPNLLAERKRIVKELEATSRRNTLLYSGLLIISLGMIGYQIHKKRSYKKRFLALMSQEQIVASKSSESGTTEKSLISEEIVSDILAHLTNFENSLGFTDTCLSLQKLATTFHTNANYLSKVINQHKHTTFSNYINQLRIDYAVQQLKTNSLWRKYTVKAIASEVGFNNAESFSKAFYKYTELKPSYFIKELEKQNN